MSRLPSTGWLSWLLGVAGVRHGPLRKGSARVPLGCRAGQRAGFQHFVRRILRRLPWKSLYCRKIHAGFESHALRFEVSQGFNGSGGLLGSQNDARQERGLQGGAKTDAGELLIQTGPRLRSASPRLGTQKPLRRAGKERAHGPGFTGSTFASVMCRLPALLVASLRTG